MLTTGTYRNCGHIRTKLSLKCVPTPMDILFKLDFYAYESYHVPRDKASATQAALLMTQAAIKEGNSVCFGNVNEPLG